MGRAFEYRKATKLKRWGNMARVFTKLGKQITIAVREGGPEPDTNPRLRAVARRCRAPRADKRYRDSFELRSALQGQTDKRLYVVAIAFLLVMIAILGWFCWKQPAL